MKPLPGKPFVIDSSGWIEFTTGSAKAERYAPYFRSTDDVMIPTLTIFEVYRRIKSRLGEQPALVTITKMRGCRVIELSEDIAVTAGDLSLRYRLAAADSIVFATAVVHNATLITSDNDFRHIPGVVII